MSASAYTVASPTGQMPIWVMDRRDFSANFMLLATRAAQKVCLRVAGGCSGMNGEDKEQMLAYFSEALSGFQGMIWSGATRQVKGGAVDQMVTEVPGIVAAANPGAVALGTAPRTGTLNIRGESRFALDEDGTLANPNLTGMLIVQDGSDNPLGWDGDLDVYFSLMEKLKTYGGWPTVGLVAWNGGGVTEQEILRSARLGWPTLLVRGSGRKTDEIAERFMAGDRELLDSLPNGHRMMLAERGDPGTLRRLLVQDGFLA